MYILELLVWIKHFNAEALFYVLVLSIAVKAKYKASFLRLIGLSESDFDIENVQLTFLYTFNLWNSTSKLTSNIKFGFGVTLNSKSKKIASSFRRRHIYSSRVYDRGVMKISELSVNEYEFLILNSFASSKY